MKRQKGRQQARKACDLQGGLRGDGGGRVSILLAGNQCMADERSASEVSETALTLVIGRK